MQEHTKIYMKAFGYVEQDYIPSELGNGRAVDVHHIDARGMGGTKAEDRIEELMGLTREQHNKYGDKKQYMAMLYNAHRSYLRKARIWYDEDYLKDKIKYWSQYGDIYL